MQFVAELIGTSVKEAAQIIVEFLDESGAQAINSRDAMVQIPKTSLLEAISDFCHSLIIGPGKLTKKNQVYLDYLKNRASSDMILKYHLGIGPDASYRKMKLDEFLGRRSLLDQYGKAEAILRQLAGKVVIPIHDEMGQLVSFTGRRIKVNNDEVRYKRPKGLSSYGVLYGLHLAKGAIKERDQVIVIEGPFDCMSLVSLGLESRLLQNVVAMMTCSMSAYKLSVLKKYTKNIVVCLDGDKASDINIVLPLVKTTF